MARAGIYKWDVQQARTALLDEGKHPSVDAVRVRLGNTGSKTTIHRYLKELEEEEGNGGRAGDRISEALQALVARLAEQLQDEAETRIAAVRAEQQAQETQNIQEMAALRENVSGMERARQELATSLAALRADHDAAMASLQEERLARRTAELAATNAHERLAEHERHRASLEEKHQHARQALEHFRDAAKEQREQEARRHAQQVQELQAELRLAQQTIMVKLGDITRLNQEGGRLANDLVHLREARQEAQEANRGLTRRVAELEAVAHQVGVLTVQLDQRKEVERQLRAQLADAAASEARVRDHVHKLERDLAAARASELATRSLADAWRQSGRKDDARPNEQ